MPSKEVERKYVVGVHQGVPLIILVTEDNQEEAKGHEMTWEEAHNFQVTLYEDILTVVRGLTEESFLKELSLAETYIESVGK